MSLYQRFSFHDSQVRRLLNSIGVFAWSQKTLGLASLSSQLRYSDEDEVCIFERRERKFLGDLRSTAIK